MRAFRSTLQGRDWTWCSLDEGKLPASGYDLSRPNPVTYEGGNLVFAVGAPAAIIGLTRRRLYGVIRDIREHWLVLDILGGERHNFTWERAMCAPAVWTFHGPWCALDQRRSLHR